MISRCIFHKCIQWQVLRNWPISRVHKRSKKPSLWASKLSISSLTSAFKSTPEYQFLKISEQEYISLPNLSRLSFQEWESQRNTVINQLRIVLAYNYSTEGTIAYLINQLVFEFFRILLSFWMKCIRHLSIHSYSQQWVII